MQDRWAWKQRNHILNYLLSNNESLTFSWIQLTNNSGGREHVRTGHNIREALPPGISMCRHINFRDNDDSSLNSILVKISYHLWGVCLFFGVSTIFSKLGQVRQNKRETLRISQVQVKRIHLACHQPINGLFDHVEREIVSRGIEHHSSVNMFGLVIYNRNRDTLDLSSNRELSKWFKASYHSEVIVCVYWDIPITLYGKGVEIQMQRGVSDFSSYWLVIFFTFTAVYDDWFDFLTVLFSFIKVDKRLVYFNGSSRVFERCLFSEREMQGFDTESSLISSCHLIRHRPNHSSRRKKAWLDLSWDKRSQEKED